jgi:uncharacterized protein
VTRVTLLEPPARSGASLAHKECRLREALVSCDRTLVAYSGGVDSTFLLAAAFDTLGERAMGVIARSPSLPEVELRDALDTAREHGLPVRVIETHEMERKAYRANGRDRCYHCKSELFERLDALAASEGWTSVAYGAVTDDLGDDRPGMEAARCRSVRAPLLEADLSKMEVRILSRRMGLRVWDKPQSACLASRIPHGTEVTPQRLGQVEAAERWIRDRFAVRILRVRHLGSTARIETEPSDIPRLAAALPDLGRGLAEWGFTEVVVDPDGYRRPDPLPIEKMEDTRNVQGR